MGAAQGSGAAAASLLQMLLWDRPAGWGSERPSQVPGRLCVWVWASGHAGSVETRPASQITHLEDEVRPYKSTKELFTAFFKKEIPVECESMESSHSPTAPC